jgi:hypothetical protein
MLESRNFLNTPILFIVFNRLETTKLVFQEIRKAKPVRLYISSDGPRSYKKGETLKVNLIRQFILENIDWQCEVKKLFRDDNLGCQFAVTSAISWFFDQEEQGIILEDDCLPSQSFFWYCETMLNQFRFDNRISSISGNLREVNSVPGNNDIYKSSFFNMWGWATWRRQWQLYDSDVFKKVSASDFDQVLTFTTKPKVLRYWKRIFFKMLSYEKNTIWDYQMFYICFINKQFTIYPKFNLVKNIGFGDDATHTFDKFSLASNIDLIDFIPCNLDLKFDQLINIDEVFYDEYSCKNFLEKLIRKIRKNYF